MVVDSEGQQLLSRRITNKEVALLKLISTATMLSDGDEITRAIDLKAGERALLIILLIAAGQLYIPGRALDNAAGSYRRAGKPNAKVAAVTVD